MERLPTSEQEANENEYTAGFDFLDVMVLSQTCDIIVQPNGVRRVSQIVACPVWELPRLRKVQPEVDRSGFLGNVIKGHVPLWHALAPCKLPGLERPHMFLELKRILTIPVDQAEELAGQQSPRLRLLSPWREQMSYAVGTLLSRPAIPHPVPPLPKPSE